MTSYQVYTRARMSEARAVLAERTPFETVTVRLDQ